MDTKDTTIGFLGHQITRRWAPHNAYIHYEYTVTGPLFDKPFVDNNLRLVKNEIRKRAQANPDWYQKYLNYRRRSRQIVNKSK